MADPKLATPAWAEVVRQQKQTWVEADTRGDTPPMVIAERDGEVWALAIAPQVDKNYGLHAAAVLRVCIDPDVMILSFDAHMAMPAEGETMEDFRRDKLRGKSMQEACDADGACDLDLITDVLIAFRMDRTGDLRQVIMPYRYHGKDGPPFRWLDDAGILDAVPAGGKLPDALRQISGLPPIIDTPMVMEFGPVVGMSRERRLYHAARAGVIQLAQSGFACIDYVTDRHPEWTGPETPYPSSLRIKVHRLQPKGA